MARDSARGRDKKPDFPSIKIISPPLRLSYPKIFDPEKNDQGADVWETDAYVPPNKDGAKFLKELEDALYSVMEEYFGHEDEWPSGKNDGHPDEKIKWRKADKLPDALNEDWAMITARSYSPVGIVDADRNDVLNKREAYGGRWARLSLTVTVYDNKSKGPTIYLNNVQLLDNDESFGGRPAAERDFDEWNGEELAEGGRDRGRGRDREDSADDGGRGRGRGSRDDGRRGDRSGARSDRDEGRQDREGSRDRGRSRGDDEGPSRRGDGVSSRGSDRGGSDRDSGRGRDRGEGRDTGDGRRASREDDSRGGGRERSRDRGRDDDGDRGGSRGRGRADAREDDTRSARDDEGRSSGRGGGGRGGRDRDDDRDQDERPSRSGRGRDDRDDAADDDWN